MPLRSIMLTRYAALLASCAALVACKSTSRPPESNAPSVEQVQHARSTLEARHSAHIASLRALQQEPLSDFVVLTQDTPLFHSEEAARAAAPTPPAPTSAYARRDAETSDTPRHLTTFIVLQDKQDVAEVGILPPEQLPYHCTSPLSRPDLYNLEIRLWVRKDALVPVLSEPWTTTFEDKTAYSFLPGTPARLSSTLYTDERLHFNLSAHGFGIDVAQDEANPISLALSYADPFSRASSISRDDLSVLPSDTILWLGQKPLIRVAELDRSLRHIHQQRRFDSQTIMVALASSCVQVAAIANRTDVLRASSATSRASSPYRSPLAPTPLARDAQHRIMYWSPEPSSDPERASHWTIRWPDQSPAGITRSSRTVQGVVDARASDESGMNCYTLEALNLDLPLCTPSTR